MRCFVEGWRWLMMNSSIPYDVSCLLSSEESVTIDEDEDDEEDEY